MKYTQDNLKELTPEQLIQIIINAQTEYAILLNKYNRAVPVKINTELPCPEFTDKKLTVLYKDTALSISVKSEKHHNFIKEQLQDNRVPVQLYHKAGFKYPTFQVITRSKLKGE